MKRNRAERARNRARQHPEWTISVECMCFALASFRTSDEWQAIGVRSWWKRWGDIWFNVTLAWKNRPWWAGTPEPTIMQGIWKREYNTATVTSIDVDNGVVTMRSDGPEGIEMSVATPADRGNFAVGMRLNWSEP